MNIQQKYINKKLGRINTFQIVFGGGKDVLGSEVDFSCSQLREKMTNIYFVLLPLEIYSFS